MEYYADRADSELVTDPTLAGLTEPDIEAMLADVWATLELPPQPAPIAPLPDGSLSASANLHGDAENLDAELQLMVTVDQGAAGTLVAAFFGSDSDPDPTAVFDAVGELANMCAGAVKTLLEGEWIIGIPNRADGSIAQGAGWMQSTVPVEGGRVTLAVGPGAPDTVNAGVAGSELGGH